MERLDPRDERRAPSRPGRRRRGQRPLVARGRLRRDPPPRAPRAPPRTPATPGRARRSSARRGSPRRARASPGATPIPPSTRRPGRSPDRGRSRSATPSPRAARGTRRPRGDPSRRRRRRRGPRARAARDRRARSSSCSGTCGTTAPTRRRRGPCPRRGPSPSRPAMSSSMKATGPATAGAGAAVGAGGGAAGAAAGGGSDPAHPRATIAARAGASFCMGHEHRTPRALGHTGVHARAPPSGGRGRRPVPRAFGSRG